MTTQRPLAIESLGMMFRAGSPRGLVEMFAALAARIAAAPDDEAG